MATMTKRSYQEVSSASDQYDRKRRMSVVGVQTVSHGPGPTTTSTNTASVGGSDTVSNFEMNSSSNSKSAVSVLEEENEEINSIIASLSLPDPKLQVAITNANHTSNTEVQAYAKLAGPTWTYYVQKLNITIGRASDPGDCVEIDLSPFKIVSRRHATIQYNLEGRYWEIVVLGRNGVRIDKVSHKQGSTRLYSGNIIDIGGVQMMFVLPDVTPQVAPIMRDSILNQQRNNINNQHLHHNPMAEAVYNKDDQQASGGPLSSLATAAAVASESDAHLTNVNANNNVPVATAAVNAYVPYPKGVAIVTRPQIRGLSHGAQYVFDQDLSADDAKDIKPPYSYATMITQAILSSEDMMMSLSEIYDWIASSYSFYRHSKSGWQNSIRHNLSLNKAFEKVPRKANEPGKGMNWQITPEYREEFIRKANLGRLVKGRTSTVQQRLIDSPMKQQQKQYEHVLKPMRRDPVQAQQNQPQLQQQPQPFQHQPAAEVYPSYMGHMGSVNQQPSAMQQQKQQPPNANDNANANANAQTHLPAGPSYGSANPDNSIVPAKTNTSDANYTIAYVETDSDEETAPVNINPPRFAYATPKKSTSVTNYDQRYNDTFGLTTTPSPSRQRYLGVSQLEAYTPDRGGSRTIPLNERADDTYNDKKSESVGGESSNSQANNQLNNISGDDSGGNSIGNSNNMDGGDTSQKNANTFSKINTPMPVAPAGRLQLAPPSASQQLPSSFMPASSPAPFWKFMQMSSTPVRPGDGSPTKFSSPSEASAGRSTGNGHGNNSAGNNGGSSNNEPAGRRDSSDDALGDLPDVDLTRGFRQIGNWRRDADERTPERLRS